MKKATAPKKSKAKPEKNGVPLLEDGAELIRRKNNPHLERVSQIYAFVILCVFPLLLNSQTYWALTEFKYTTFAMLTVAYFIAVAACLLLFAVDKSKWEKRTRQMRLRLTLPQIFALAYLAAAIISSIFAIPDTDIWRGSGRYEGLYTVILYIGSFVLASFFAEYDKRIFIGMGAMLLASSIISLFQYYNVNIFGIYRVDYNFVNTRFIGTVGNIDMVGGLYALAIPVTACCYVLFDNKLTRYALMLPAFALSVFILQGVNVDSGRMGLIAAFIVMIPMLLTSLERAARMLEVFAATAFALGMEMMLPPIGGDAVGASFVGSSWVTMLLVAAVVLTGLAFLCRRLDKKVRISAKTLRIAVSVLLVIAIAVGLVFVYNYSGEHRLVFEASELLHGRLSDEAGSWRGFLWKRCMPFIAERPWFGYGPDTFLEAFMPYSEEFQQLTGSNIVFDFPHNDFLQIAANLGLVALAAYLGLLITLAVRAFKRIDKNPLLIITIAAMVGYLAHSFFSFSIAIIAPLMWVMAGYTDKLIRQTPSEKREE